MKKLYSIVLLAIIIALSSSNTFAQTSDLALLRYISTPISDIDTAAPTLHLMTDQDVIIVNPTDTVAYLFQYGFVNLGPDTLGITDTIYLQSPSFYQAIFPINIAPTGGIGVGDTVFLNPIELTFAGAASGSFPGVCDSAWAIHINNSVVTDPNISNNEYCNTITIQAYNVGVAQVNKNVNNFSIFPNPATSVVNFNYNFAGVSKATLNIVDVVGRTVYQEEITDLSANKVAVNVAGFVPGMYMATLTVDDKRIVGKFNVQK